jgi:hypothetical protein
MAYVETWPVVCETNRNPSELSAWVKCDGAGAGLTGTCVSRYKYRPVGSVTWLVGDGCTPVVTLGDGARTRDPSEGSMYCDIQAASAFVLVRYPCLPSAPGRTRKLSELGDTVGASGVSLSRWRPAAFVRFRPSTHVAFPAAARLTFRPGGPVRPPQTSVASSARLRSSAKRSSRSLNISLWEWSEQSARCRCSERP